MRAAKMGEKYMKSGAMEEEEELDQPRPLPTLPQNMPWNASHRHMSVTTIRDDHHSAPDVNTYQQKKNLAEGMMDLALLSANANQLRFVIESSPFHRYYWPNMLFLSASILFQILVGIGLIINSRYNVGYRKEYKKANKINNATIIGIFFITTINVFVATFSVAI